jgi:phage terminase large subunit-like protein
LARLINGLTHPEVATQYARDVVNGVVPACKWIYLACVRHLEDLIASEDPAYPYIFDHKKAQRFCTFFEMMPHVEGKWAARGELLMMEPWQCFFACSVFGWVKKSDGYRKHKRVYACIPRKSAKSTFAAVVGLFCLILDNEFGAQVYSGAGSREQASFVFNPAKKMMQKSPAICKKYGVEVNADSITVLKTNSKFSRLIGNPGDGGNVSCAIIDEMHEMEDSRLYDTMTSGMGAREQPLAFVITTAGFNTSGPCYLLQKDMEKMLEGISENPTRFALIYTIDLEPYTRADGTVVPADDWTQESAARKASPNWGVSVNAADTLEEVQEAIVSSEKQNLVKTKKFNIWCFARNGFFNVEKWNKCADLELKIEDFLGQPCVKGLDLASEVDLAADINLFQKAIEDPNTLVTQLHYYLFSKLYIPESTVAMPTNQHYQKWVHDGHLIATSGDQIDYATIKLEILADIAQFDLRELDCDPHQSTLLSQELRDAEGIEVVPVQQNPPTLSIPMKWLQGLINSGRIHHNGNPVMTWCVSNVVAREDANENVFPRKERIENKIDGVSALLCAMYRIRAVLGEDTGFLEFDGF